MWGTVCHVLGGYRCQRPEQTPRLRPPPFCVKSAGANEAGAVEACNTVMTVASDCCSCGHLHFLRRGLRIVNIRTVRLVWTLCKICPESLKKSKLWGMLPLSDRATVEKRNLKNENSFFFRKNNSMLMSFGKTLVTLYMTTKMPKLINNACL